MTGTSICSESVVARQSVLFSNTEFEAAACGRPALLPCNALVPRFPLNQVNLTGCSLQCLSRGAPRESWLFGLLWPPVSAPGDPPTKRLSQSSKGSVQTTEVFNVVSPEV